MKKTVLTGSSGLIGAEAIKALQKADFEVFELNTKTCNLFDKNAVKEFFKKIQPAFLLHFAWITTGDYLTNPLNIKLVETSLNMLAAFKENGGKRAVFAGTCLEYDFKDETLKENSPLKPVTLYAKSKNDLRIKAENFCVENDISFGWGRIFYVFGKNEKEGRLTSTLINNFKNNKTVKIHNGGLIRDYMYTKDIASAFVKFLQSDTTGAVNISTGKGIAIGEYALKFAKRMNQERFLEIQYDKTDAPLKIIGDNTKLIKEIGFRPKYSIDNAIDEILKNGAEI